MTEKATHRILVVDDEGSIRKALERVLRRAGFMVELAESGQVGLECLKRAEEPFSLILSDQRMPEMNGADFLEKSKTIAPDVGRFLLTGYSDYEALVDAINRGEIHRYMGKPWNDDELVLQIRQTIEQVSLWKDNREMASVIKRQNEELQELNQNLEHKVIQRSKLLIKQQEDFESSFMEAFRLLSALVEMVSPSLGDYLLHVGELSREVAQCFGLSKTECDHIEIAGLFHDVGLVGMPQSMLYGHRDDMGETAYNLYSNHPVIAAVCFETVPSFTAVSDIILNHHEYMDGSGSPNQSEGDSIPMGSRILGTVSDYCRIVDSWPDEAKEISQLVKKVLPQERIANLPDTEGEALRKTVADALLAEGTGTRYDEQVVINLKKVLAEEAKENSREKWVGVEDLQPGMTLRKAVYLDNGQPLMSQGLRLNEKLIDSLSKIHQHGKIAGRIFIAAPPE